MNELNRKNPAYRKMVLDILQSRPITNAVYDWEVLTPDLPILQLIPQEAIDFIKDLVTSPRYAGNPRYREKMIDQTMSQFGFTHFAGGTNRLVYTHYLTPRMIFKVALDGIGIKDNPAEFYNQQFLKPFCTKVFECSPCGTIASFQKVHPIMSKEEFNSIYKDYYRLIWYNIAGKYVMDDIGDNFFKNFGIWDDHFVVILDFPYMYELDGSKLYCNALLDNGTRCHGEIDYSPGFVDLVCTKCGKKYRASDLAKSPQNGGMLIRKKGGKLMKFSLKRGDKVIKTFDTEKSAEFLSRESTSNTKVKVGPVKLIKKKVIIKEPVIKEEIKATKNNGTVVNTRPSSINNKNTTILSKVIKVPINKIGSAKDTIIHNDNINTNIKVDLTTVKKVVTVPASTVKRLSNNKEINIIIKNVPINIKNEEKEDIKKEDEVITKEDNKEEVVTINEQSHIEEDINNKEEETTSSNKKENEVITKEDNKEEKMENPRIVYFVKDIPDIDTIPNNYSLASEDSDFIFFAVLKGLDNEFKEHTEILNYPIILDNTRYDLYAYYEGNVYPVTEYDENGNIVFYTNNYDEDEEDNSDSSKVEEDTNNQITNEDIIETLKSTGKHSIEDIMNYN